MLQTSAAALAMSGSIVEALEVLDRAHDTARALGDVTQFFGFVSVTRSWVAHRAGRVQEAEADAQVSGFRRPGRQPSTSPTRSPRSGNAVLERRPTEEAFDLFAQHGLDETTELETALAASVYLVRGRLHLALGRPRQAVSDLERCRDILTTVGFTSPDVHRVADGPRAGSAGGGRRRLGAGARHRGHRHQPARSALRARSASLLRTSGLVKRGPRGLELLAESVEVLERIGRLARARQVTRRAGRRASTSRQALRRAGPTQDGFSTWRAGCGGLTVAARARDGW